MSSFVDFGMENVMDNIMFLCHGAGNGGAERVITTLASEFSKRDFSVLLVTTNSDKNTYETDENVKREIIISKSSNVIGRTLDRIKKIRKCILENKIDCIISFSAVPNMQVLLASLGLKTKVIVSERTDPSRYPESKIGRILRNKLYVLADAVVFQTKEAQSYFENQIKAKSYIIPNPIRENLPTPFSGKREKRIVGIGSLGNQKNWIIAIKAFELFVEEYDDYRFDIYGEGPLRGELQKYIDNNDNIKNKITLCGFSMDAVQEMNSAAMYISSSDYEGISNAMLEALATGVPTICTDCPVGGAREFIENNKNGILVPVRDYKALCDAMLELCNNETLADKLSRNSIEIKEKLSLQKIVDIWEKLVNDELRNAR